MSVSDIGYQFLPMLREGRGEPVESAARGRPGEGYAVSMFDLLRSAMRQRPNEIMIGEIRGEEGAIAFQAMQTGHTCLSTFHASSVEKLIQRLDPKRNG